MFTYSHVFFDFDGVLCDSLTTAIEEFNRLRVTEFPALPRVVTKQDMVAVYGGPLRTSLRKWLSAAESKRFFELHSHAMAERASELEPFAGIGTLLGRLPVRSASIVTSAYSEAVREILRREDDSDFPSIHVIAGRELGQPKSEKMRGILAELGLHPSDAIYVGDLESDILYCRELPIDVVAVTYGYHPGWHLRKQRPEFVVRSVGELAALLERIVHASAITSA